MSLRLSSGKYFGTIINKKKFKTILLMEKIHGAGDNIPKHYHNNAYLSFVLGGSWLENQYKKRVIYKQNDLVYHPSGEIHSDCFQYNAVRLFNIELTENFMIRLREISKEFNESVTFQNLNTTLLAKKAYRKFCFPDNCSSHVIDGLTLELLASIYRGKDLFLETVKPRWLQTAVEMIEDNLLDKLSISEIALKLNIHPVYFIRIFRKFFNTTPGEYRRRRRIENACWELIHTDIPLAEIALNVGFFDQSHFCKTFKRFIGITPRQFRFKRNS